jgi:hypothetical protein
MSNIKHIAHTPDESSANRYINVDTGQVVPVPLAIASNEKVVLDNLTSLRLIPGALKPLEEDLGIAEGTTTIFEQWVGLNLPEDPTGVNRFVSVSGYTKGDMPSEHFINPNSKTFRMMRSAIGFESLVLQNAINFAAWSWFAKERASKGDHVNDLISIVTVGDKIGFSRFVLKVKAQVSRALNAVSGQDDAGEILGSSEWAGNVIVQFAGLYGRPVYLHIVAPGNLDAHYVPSAAHTTLPSFPSASDFDEASFTGVSGSSIATYLSTLEELIKSSPSCPGTDFLDVLARGRSPRNLKTVAHVDAQGDLVPEGDDFVDGHQLVFDNTDVAARFMATICNTHFKGLLNKVKLDSVYCISGVRLGCAVLSTDLSLRVGEASGADTDVLLDVLDIIMSRYETDGDIVKFDNALYGLSRMIYGEHVDTIAPSLATPNSDDADMNIFTTQPMIAGHIFKNVKITQSLAQSRLFDAAIYGARDRFLKLYHSALTGGVKYLPRELRYYASFATFFNKEAGRLAGRLKPYHFDNLFYALDEATGLTELRPYRGADFKVATIV